MRDHLFGMVITKKIAQLVHKWAVANKQIGATMGLIFQRPARSSLKFAILDCEKWILTYYSYYMINSHLDYNYFDSYLFSVLKINADRRLFVFFIVYLCLCLFIVRIFYTNFLLQDNEDVGEVFQDEVNQAAILVYKDKTDDAMLMVRFVITR